MTTAETMRPARSFSTDPRNLRPLDADALAHLQQSEADAAERLLRVLDTRSSRVALVGRRGSDLSVLPFEGEHPRVTHVGIALRERDGWWMHHLMNTHEGPSGDLYRQPLVDFFRDDPLEYRAAVLVPSEALQQRIAGVLESGVALRLHSPRYSRVAYPFATLYQNSNQWVAEVVGAAQSGATSRERAQHHLAERGFLPSVLRGVGLVRQALGRMTYANTHFDDHPWRSRLRGRLAFVLGSSLARYVRRTDEILLDTEIALDTERPCAADCPHF